VGTEVPNQLQPADSVFLALSLKLALPSSIFITSASWLHLSLAMTQTAVEKP